MRTFTVNARMNWNVVPNQVVVHNDVGPGPGKRIRVSLKNYLFTRLVSIMEWFPLETPFRLQNDRLRDRTEKPGEREERAGEDLDGRARPEVTRESPNISFQFIDNQEDFYSVSAGQFVRDEGLKPGLLVSRKRTFGNGILVFSALLVVMLLSMTRSFGQESRWTPYLDLSFSGAKNHFSVAPGASFLYGFGEKKTFNAGVGLRYTGSFSRDQEFTTAPARLTSGQEGPQVLFAPDVPENVDTFLVAKNRFHAVNLAVYLQYRVHPKVQIGFNIDAIGFTVGPKAKGRFASIRSDNQGLENVGAKPYPFNLLLVSDNDLGSLNSELYVRYLISKTWAVKGGATFLFTEYQTDLKPAFDNDRFRNKSLQLMVGFTYLPFKK